MISLNVRALIPDLKQIAFRVKLGLAIVVLSTSVASLGVVYFYTRTQQFILHQTQRDLKRLGHTASLLFDRSARAAIVRLTVAAEAEAKRAPQVSVSDVLALAPGETLNSLSPAARNRLQASPDFQTLVLTLQRLKYVGQDTIEPFRSTYPYEVSHDHIRAFLVVPAPELTQYQVVKFLVSGSYQPQGDWPGNPIGNLFVSPTQNFIQVFDGTIQIDEQFIQVSFYKALGVLIPIKDEQGKTIAALGIDYIAESEFDELNKFKLVGVSIIATSCILSIFLAVLLAQWLGQPITKLQQATQKVREGNYDTVIQLKSHDELGELAATFNQMVVEIRNSSNTLELQNQQLKQLNRIKDEFLANTSHELRTPLHSIIGIAQSMLDEAAGQFNREHTRNLELLILSGQRLVHLVNDLLDFSQLKHQAIQLQLKPVSLRAIAEIVLKLDRALVGTKDLQLINDVPTDLPWVSADENRLQQILHNLIGNAIKFTEQGQINVTARVLNSSTVEVAVSDTGIGIPEDQFNTIFESFEQIDSSASRLYGGAGLGLAITRNLVLLHGGEIRVESTLQQGSTFYFTLPISLVDSPTSTDPVLLLRQSFDISTLKEIQDWSDELIPDHDTHERGIPRILIVDDEAVNLQILKNFLRLEDYSITSTTSGQIAIQLLENGLIPDLVLLDIMMPRITGYDVIQLIREKFSANQLPIILLSARNQPKDIVFGLELGANDYLVKPVDRGELLARLQTHLQIRQLQEQAIQLAVDYERQQAEFLDALPIGVAIHNSDGSILYFNQAAKQILQKDVVQSVRMEQIPLAYQVYQSGSHTLCQPEQLPIHLVLQGQQVHCDNLELHLHDQVVSLEVLGTPIWDNHGRIKYGIITFQDVTNRKRAEQILANYSQELEQDVKQRTIEITKINQQLQVEIQERELAEQTLRLLNQQLQKLATIDGLTQVANRRYFDQELQREWQRLSREQQPLSLILLDVDYFKYYNDCYGHQAGDACLIQVAHAIQRTVQRSADLVARYGGEEFAVILPNTDPRGASSVAEAIQQSIRQLGIPHARSGVGSIVSVSLGIASCIPEVEALPEGLVALADQALYQAKQQGRDRYISMTQSLLIESSLKPQDMES
ncbi:diguanylate cyclase domain-containing protein [Pantanalinema rosaneae CENA516]|uniref:diguanylate cyclase domain-containing protein n=1 Tax=Pantanalinema rosaneae TaxID=1620701 RepID=UPI003D6EABFC